MEFHQIMHLTWKRSAVRSNPFWRQIAPLGLFGGIRLLSSRFWREDARYAGKLIG